MLKIRDVCRLMKKYARCPECGCRIGANAKCEVTITSDEVFFKRVCDCGWSITLGELRELPPEGESADADKG